jgi:hypothetical protein
MRKQSAPHIEANAIIHAIALIVLAFYEIRVNTTSPTGLRLTSISLG